MLFLTKIVTFQHSQHFPLVKEKVVEKVKEEAYKKVNVEVNEKVKGKVVQKLKEEAYEEVKVERTNSFVLLSINYVVTSTAFLLKILFCIKKLKLCKTRQLSRSVLL
jgi:hypothetical protein